MLWRTRRAGTARPYGLGESKAAKKRKRDREQIESLKAQSTSQTFQKGKSDGKGASQHPRKLGNQFVTSRDGVQIFAMPLQKGSQVVALSRVPTTAVIVVRFALVLILMFLVLRLRTREGKAAISDRKSKAS